MTVSTPAPLQHLINGEWITGSGDASHSQAVHDGTAELWFASVADKDAFYSDPEYLARVQPDERVFADMTRTLFFVTEEEAVV